MTNKREVRTSLEALAVMSGGKDISDCKYIGKPQRKAIQHEAQIQIALFEWAALSRGKYPELTLMYHIPNGGYRDAVTGYNLKRQGVKSGVPDICLPVARGQYHGLYVELKADGGRVQESQKAWIAEFDKQGYKAVVCFGLDEAIKAIEVYLSMRQ